ncbi:MAG TPA: translation initiation factor IF-2 [Vicinamibacterales bacterium]|nr:translation initiation factor IF-2 [Vicinamibacterales bacterium]
MSTVRVYKVAELLDISSNDVLALLKKNHGIELKSASSTLEEIVARQFVERLAKQKGITLPKGDIFSEQAGKQVKTAAKPGKKGAAAPAPEPPKPAAPTLGPPRLIKKAKPAEPKPDEAVDAPIEVPAPPPIEQPVIEVAAPVVEEPIIEEPPQAEPAPAARVAEPEVVREKSGRFVPPSIRLRVEEPGKAPPSAPPLQPKRQVIPQPPRVVPPAPRPPQAATGNLARPQGQRPFGQPRPPQSNTAAMLGGPRPLPSQPVRPSTGMPQRPGQPPMRPGFRPQQQHRPSGLKPAQKRDALQTPRQQAPAPAAPPPITRTITFSEGMTVKDLADRLEVRVKDALKALLDRRMMMTINSAIDLETARALAAGFGAEVETRSFEQEIIAESDKSADPKDIATRSPVVTIMGHVDHGKTTLLDSIRETRVAEREAGGITQHIGAYLVPTSGGRSIVFLDTPGHSAFTMMRARGAKITDVVVLVVAADDGVMPQTREAIDHAKAANVKIIVAVNKIDKPGANPETVKRQLTDLGLMPEDWGGQTVFVEVSAKKKTGIDTLLEMILLVTEIDDLKANPKRSAIGTVIETKLDRGRGPVATVLIQDGTLRVGDNVIAGPVVGKVRALIDDRGRNLKLAGPSTPVELLGLESLPSPGDGFQQVADAAKARQIATFRQGQAKDKAHAARGSRLTLESLQAQLSDEGAKDLPIIIKADVQGSAEVLADTLAKLSDDKTRIKIIHSAVGAINESDVLLATASNAIVIGFNVRPDRNAAEVAEREKVDIRQHSVIYHVTDEIKKAMTGLLEPTFKEQRIGIAQVRETFKVPKIGTIAGCMVTDGRITRQGDAQARLLRDNVVVWEGKLASLKRFKDDVSEVKTGFECGLGLQNFNDVKVGDVIEVFQMERVAQPA